jgi:transcriptional regulator with XRE-family HTH domain
VPTVAQCFTENLRRALASSSLTQEQVARRAGIDRTQMTKLAKGTQVPRVDTMIKLEAALGLERAALVKGIVWNPAVGPNGEFKREQSG